MSRLTKGIYLRSTVRNAINLANDVIRLFFLYKLFLLRKHSDFITPPDIVFGNIVVLYDPRVHYRY